MNITFRNAFHGTARTIRAEIGQELSQHQIRKLECAGSCQCGGHLGRFGEIVTPGVKLKGTQFGYKVVAC